MRTVRTEVTGPGTPSHDAHPQPEVVDLRRRVEEWCAGLTDPPGRDREVGAGPADSSQVDGSPADVAEGTRLLRALVAAAGPLAAVTLEVDPSDERIDRAAADAGLGLVRDVVELRRDLPLPADLHRRGTSFRAFRPGADEAAVVAANNRAFEWHPEQSGWSVDDLVAREREAWFDPEGFLVHDDDGEITGFCWTKVHHDEDPPAGEIFVIGVDPAHHGRGLGRDLVVAGLDLLADRGLRRALLWTEADNRPARELYGSLGFTPTRHHRWYRHPAGAGTGAPHDRAPAGSRRG